MANAKLSDEGVRREVERRKVAAKELGLPEVVEFLYEELSSYPGWQKTAKEKCFHAIINPREIKVGKVRGVAFLFDGKEYGLGRYDGHIMFPDGEECDSRDYFIYNEKRVVLFESTGYVEYDEFGSSYRFEDIEAFIPGAWTKDILELHRQLKSYTEQQDADWEKEEETNEAEELRKKFGL
jgi:ASC-1-like (ASCH) protein